MKDKIIKICFWGSVAGYALMSVALFLFHPASMMKINQGNLTLQRVSGLMFWVGALLGTGLLITTFILRKKHAPNFEWILDEDAQSSLRIRITTWLFQTPMSVICVVVFLVGLIGSIASLMHSTYSSYHTFAFMALTLLGISEYIVFNNLNFAYITTRSEIDEQEEE